MYLNLTIPRSWRECTTDQLESIASVIQEEAFPYLDAPVIRLGAKQCPLPFNLGLENAVVPQPQDIYDAVMKTLYLK